MRKTIILLIALFVAHSYTWCQTKERSEVPEKYTWNLKDIYLSDEAWKEKKEEITPKINNMGKYRGKLNSSKVLLECLEFSFGLHKELVRLYTYASMKSDEDTRNSKYVGMEQEMQQHFTDFGSVSSFVEPEIIEIGPETIERFVAEQPDLKKYPMYLDNLFRTQKHTLSEKEEKILALSGLIAESPASIYRTFSNAEMPYPEVKLSDGSIVKIDKAGYNRYRALPNRSDRELVFSEFWKAHNNFKATFGENLNGEIKQHMFYAKARGYNSSLEMSLDANNIPVEVYHSLVENINQNLSTFHRYLLLRKKLMKLDTLKYSDLYAPVVKDIDITYSFEKAIQLIPEALKPLGEEYVSVVKKAFNERWIDVYPTPGKRSGAYSNGSVYDVHPYILLNYNGLYDDVSTLAHELGHTMQSYFSNKNQLYPTADYPTFVAEVASTFNEALLVNNVLSNIKDDKTRLSILMNYLDGFKGTVFRQTQFAEFELTIHEKAEAGMPLTGDYLTELYGNILKKYYGHDKGVCHIDNLVTMEWAFIPHFYLDFYVYQYSTSFIASQAISEKVLHGEKGATEKYMEFISAGGSDYPINLLKQAGVDMTSSEPFDKMIKVMNEIMDQVEEILNKNKDL